MWHWYRSAWTRRLLCQTVNLISVVNLIDGCVAITQVLVVLVVYLHGGIWDGSWFKSATVMKSAGNATVANQQSLPFWTVNLASERLLRTHKPAGNFIIYSFYSPFILNNSPNLPLAAGLIYSSTFPILPYSSTSIKKKQEYYFPFLRRYILLRL